ALHRIHPDPAAIAPEEAIAGLGWGELAPADRPYVALNMVSSADGKAAVEGRTRAISSETDRAIFHNLRTQADAVMTGAGTIRTERYGPIVKNDELRAKRQREGVAPDPLAVIVSGRLHLPVDVPLLQDPGSHVVILTQSDDELSGHRANVEYLRSERGPFDIRPLMGRLREEFGVRSVLCEGGPTLNASLLPYGLVDELFLTIAPSLAGGEDALTIVAGAPLPELVALERVSMRIGRGDFVFLVGPTGCGKSTCMRLLMKEIEPSEGRISIAGRVIGDVPRKRVPYLRRNIGVVFQDYKLLPNRTVYANVAYALEVIGEPRESIRRKVP